MNLSSLDFSRSEPGAGTVVVSHNGVELDSSPVDRAYTPTTDEIGKATMEFTVPAGLSGLQRFEITVPSTGTVSSFTLNIGLPGTVHVGAAVRRPSPPLLPCG